MSAGTCDFAVRAPADRPGADMSSGTCVFVAGRPVDVLPAAPGGLVARGRGDDLSAGTGGFVARDRGDDLSVGTCEFIARALADRPGAARGLGGGGDLSAGT